MEKAKTIIIVMLMALVLIGGIFAINQITTDKKTKQEMKNILSQIEQEKAKLTEYIIYGTHLNLKGEILSNTRKNKKCKINNKKYRQSRKKYKFRL